MFESSYVPFFTTFPLVGQLSDEEIKYEKQNMNVATCFMRLPPVLVDTFLDPVGSLVSTLLVVGCGWVGWSHFF